jgi:hypothetical protein
MMLAPILLSGCGGHETRDERVGSTIACAPVGRAEMVACDVEMDGSLLTVRRPDGGFRRLENTKTGMVAMDGAEQVENLPIEGGGVEARIGGWRYRFKGPMGARP